MLLLLYLQVFVEIIMKELGLVLSRHQFKDLMRLADNFDRMKTNSRFRKYKPFVPLKESRKAWYGSVFWTKFVLNLTLKLPKIDALKMHNWVRSSILVSWILKWLNAAVIKITTPKRVYCTTSTVYSLV